MEEFKAKKIKIINEKAIEIEVPLQESFYSGESEAKSREKLKTD